MLFVSRLGEGLLYTNVFKARTTWRAHQHVPKYCCGPTNNLSRRILYTRIYNHTTHTYTYISSRHTPNIHRNSVALLSLCFASGCFVCVCVCVMYQSVSLHDVADETGSGYGVEIAQLQKSSDMLEKAFKLAHRYVCMYLLLCDLLMCMTLFSVGGRCMCGCC